VAADHCVILSVLQDKRREKESDNGCPILKAATFRDLVEGLKEPFGSLWPCADNLRWLLVPSPPPSYV
jgi:hypothetical protein